MITVLNTHKFRFALFWRLFTNYFVVILIPVIVASMLAQLLVVRIIEKDAEKLNDVIISHFSEQTDTALNAVKTNMINMLSTSNLSSLLRVADDSPENEQRAEWIHALREQLIKLQSDKLISKAFIYFVNHDLVIDGETYTDKSYYFDFRYPLESGEKAAFLSHFKDKKMMDFTEPQSSFISALMSYPFNTASPEVYLVVNFRQDKLREQIGIPEKWVKGTAIVNGKGVMISQTGLDDNETKEVQKQVRSNSKGSQFSITNENALSLVKSEFDDSWYYVTIADLHTLMKPARMTRIISWAFLVFFLVVGSVVSYYLSRRLYRPIMEIKEGLKPSRESNAQLRSEGNEFDVIKRFSQLIISENKELSQLVNGMFPVVHEHFAVKMLLGEYRDALSIEYYAKEIEFIYDPSAVRTVLCIAFHYNSHVFEQLSETSVSFMMVELKERILSLSPSPVWLCHTKPGMMACVVQHDAFLKFGPEEAAEIVSLALVQYSQYFKATIGIGKTVHVVEDLHFSYKHAVSVLQNRGLHANVEICREQGDYDRTPWDSYLSVQDINRIFNQFQTREYDKLLQSALEMLQEGIRINATAVQVKALCADVLQTWIRAVETAHNDFNVPFYAGLFEELNRSMTWDELTRCFQDIHAILFRTEEPDHRTKQFADILAYIHEHYNEELSIEHFAGMMNMSSGHFSRNFKEEVGEKYVEYIARYRLKKAKELLLETDLKIDDIAEKIGYWGRNSFIRTFRKYEGITPAKYRAIHQ